MSNQPLQQKYGQVAVNLLREGMAIEVITRVTVEQVQQLQAKLSPEN